MSQIACDLARRLAVAGVDASVLAALVSETAALAEAINREALEAQMACLLEAYGPDAIESLGHRPRDNRP